MAFEELKERHAAMWGSAPFERVAWTLADMHQPIVEAVDGGPGEQWLDVGCGTGELAFMAAATGADVTGSDLSPVLVETARRQAAERGARRHVRGRRRRTLPYGDAQFDIVTSTIGAIFAPDHAAVASELARVCRPGGRLGMTAWMTGGEVDDFFEIIGSYAPPPHRTPASRSVGRAGYAECCLGDAFELELTEHDTPWKAESAEELWAEMSEASGRSRRSSAPCRPSVPSRSRKELLDFFGGEADRDGIAIERPTGCRRVRRGWFSARRRPAPR